MLLIEFSKNPNKNLHFVLVLNSDHPLVVDSVAALKIDTPQDAPQNGTKNPPTAQQDDLTEAVEDMASVPQSQESVCEEISTTPQPTDTDDVIPTAPPASPNVSAPAASPVASSTQPTTEINLTNSNSAGKYMYSRHFLPVFECSGHH